MLNLLSLSIVFDCRGDFMIIAVMPAHNDSSETGEEASFMCIERVERER
jgi:hypothetical protein